MLGRLPGVGTIRQGFPILAFYHPRDVRKAAFEGRKVFVFDPKTDPKAYRRARRFVDREENRRRAIQRSGRRHGEHVPPTLGRRLDAHGRHRILAIMEHRA